MIYERKKGKGVRKGKLPPPKKVELPLNSTLQDLLLFGRNEFFNKINPPLKCLSLADSSGQKIGVDDDEEWTIGAFYEANDFKPSRYKLYIMYTQV